MYVVVGNYGNESVALIQWVAQQALAPVWVVSVDTGWHAPHWPARVAMGENLARTLGFNVVRLTPRLHFSALITEKNNFPTAKFAWCAGLLKGLPLLEWLDTLDPKALATVLLPTRHNAAEFIEESPHWGDRRVWQPLTLLNDAAYKTLLTQTGLSVLNHPSRECAPCIYSRQQDLTQLSAENLQKTAALEKQIGQTFFGQPITAIVQKANPAHSESIYMGCGIPFGCGL